MKLEQILSETFEVFFAPPDRLADLKRQVKGKLYAQGNLIVAPRQAENIYFFQNHWQSARLIRFTSPGTLKAQLLSFGLPVYYQPAGRCPKPNFAQVLKPSDFPYKANPFRWIEFTVASEEFALVSECEGTMPLNQINWKENKSAPSRAYLKLWELFSRIQKWPGAHQLCIDLGSAPGGWTYVLNQLGAEVWSFDRASLHEDLIKSSRVRHQLRDAFSVKPSEFDRVDWLLSDLICYPDKLAEYIETWLESGKAENIVCTLKFKGSTDWASIKKFESFGGHLVHLNQNKHELTWYRIEN